MMPLPYFIAVADGSTIRTIHPPALGEHRKAVEMALAAVLGSEGANMGQPHVSSQVATKLGPATVDMLTQGEIARAQGYTGDACMTCGQFMTKRNGACLSCDACGTTTGCS